jgi:AcrR family transcriptional regulator
MDAGRSATELGDAVPKIVDREARRREIVEAYLRVVARDGVEQATSRALATELRVSTGALWHYFGDFDEVLVQAYGLVLARTTDRIAERSAGLRGLPALTAMLTDLLPLSKETEDEASAVVSIWGRVPHNPSLGECHATFEHVWREQIRTHLADATDLGQLVRRAPLSALADVVFVLAAGLQVERVVSEATTDAERQWRLVAAVLAPWMTEAGHAVHALPVDTRNFDERS